MFQKPLIIFAIVILVLSPTSIYSAYDLIKKDISAAEGQNISFYCKNGTSQLCCSQLAHRVSSENHSRCASMVPTNNIGYNMTLETHNLEDGRWITPKDYGDGGGGNNSNINCQPHSLLVNESETISSVSSRMLGGVKGYVSFNILHNMTSKFTISWKVPTFGSPKYALNGLSNRYKFIKNYAFEDTVYQVTIINKKPPSLLILILSIILFSAIAIAIVLVRNHHIKLLSFRSGPKYKPGPPAEPRYEPKGPAEEPKRPEPGQVW